MALSANTLRSFEVDSNINEFGVAANAVIYEGSAVGSTGGYARALTAGDTFLGFSIEKVTGTSANAGVNVRVWTRGRVQLAVTSVAVTDIGQDVYASDDGTFTLTQGSNSKVGTVHRFISSGQAIVAFDASDAGSLSGVTVLTDNSGGAAADGTIAVVTAPTAIAATLTDSTGGSGTHDDTLADGLTVTALDALGVTALGDLVATNNGWGASSEANFDAIHTKFDLLVTDITNLRAKVTTMITDVTTQNQNDSDLAQKVIELVTAQAADRTAIVALTDAIKEISTKVNEIINASR